MMGKIIFLGALAISLGTLTACSGSSNSSSNSNNDSVNDSTYISCGDDSKVASNGDALMKSGGSAIVNGQALQLESEIGRHVVMILGQSEGSSYLCTGTLLESGLVLTAAHCVASSTGRMKVVFSERPLCGATVGEIKKSLGKSVIEVTDVRVNPEYQSAFEKSGRVEEYLKNNSLTATERDELQRLVNELKVKSVGVDFAILKVNKNNIPVSALTSAVPREPVESADLSGGRLLLVGFGNIDSKSNGGGRLRATSLSLDNLMTDKDGGKDSPFWVVSQPNTGVCHGDSGGPLFFLKNQKLTLIGVTSEVGGEAGNECSGVSLFGKPWSQAEWLTRSIEELSN